MKMKVPKYIGYPGKQTSGGYGNEFSPVYDNLVDDRIVIAALKPGLPLLTSKDANVYEIQAAWDKYVEDLEALKIDPPETPKGGVQQAIHVVISNLSPISRTYENNYGDSKVLPQGGLLGEAAQDIMQLGGGNTDEIQKQLMSNDGDKLRQMLGAGVSWYNKGVEGFRNLSAEFASQIGKGSKSLGDVVSTVTDAAADLAKSPQSKIGWPKMWRDCSFAQSYQLNTRLYCFSTDNEDDYNNNIRAAIAALELFVTPKSDKGVLYTAPYMLEFQIPGMIYFPQAYVQSMNVIEGGNEGDFAQTGRPNVVDITMTIQNVYSIAVNVNPEEDVKHPGRPSVYKDLIGLASGKNVGKTSSYTTGDKSASSGKNILYENAKKNENARTFLKDKADKDIESKIRKALNPKQLAVYDKINNTNPNNNQEKTDTQDPDVHPDENLI